MDRRSAPEATEDGAQREVTALLLAWGEGDESALKSLYPLVHGELKRLARGRLRGERPGHTLQTTALVHEAFLRLVGQGKGGWESRGHFFAIAAKMMRRVLVDHARRRGNRKRGGDLVHVTLEDATDVPTGGTAEEVLRIHNALSDLAAVDPRKASMVELRYFGGLDIAETAHCLGVSPGTVMRDWTLTKAWLKRYLRVSGPSKPSSEP
ncbi:MAG: sigma-70 family RNA polymerase sigma factor [Acidobacteriota bacterium]